ncbi:N-acetyl-gamma-glutamyl-phosphate reductase [Thermodesulfobacteriota bacterium]
MTRVGVVGATGYAGSELVRILAGHPAVKLSTITSRQYAGKAFSEIYPSMKQVVDLPCEAYSLKSMCGLADIVFTALPHKLSMEIVPALVEGGKRVIDLSADFRLKDAAVYERHYQPHTAKALLSTAVYGLCEVFGDDIKAADLVGNPGCYPTSVILPLVPLIKAELIDIDSVVADSKSGISGAGRVPSLTTHFCEVNESFKAYKVAEHRHNPEMDEALSRGTGKQVSITFVPHLVPMTRGMLTTIYARLSDSADENSVRDALNSYYAGRPFVRICENPNLPDTLHVKGTNFCDIGFRFDVRNRRLILISAIDNLIKGAAGQAVQNMNIMLGLEETAGLMAVPYPL